jgi:hypothetical protein
MLFRASALIAEPYTPDAVAGVALPEPESPEPELLLPEPELPDPELPEPVPLEPDPELPLPEPEPELEPELLEVEVPLCPEFFSALVWRAVTPQPVNATAARTAAARRVLKNANPNLSFEHANVKRGPFSCNPYSQMFGFGNRA